MMDYVPTKTTLGLVRAHYEQNDEMFQEYLMQLVNYFNSNNSEDLAEFCLAQAELIPTVIPM